MSSSRMPAFLSKRIDLKNESILAAQRSIDNGSITGLADGTKLTIISTIGIVKGKVQTKFNSSDESRSEIIKKNDMIFDTRNQHIADMVGLEEDENPPLSNNVATLTITDAEIIPMNPCSGSKSYKVDVLNLFSDQIVGFSYGNITMQQSTTDNK